MSLEPPTFAGDELPDEMRCQYSSKRCENPRTNKKSGGLHKFCAMHREKANRNQMRLDRRRSVLKKQLQMQQQQQQQQQQQEELQRLRQRRFSAPAAMASGMQFTASAPSHARAFRGYAPAVSAPQAPMAHWSHGQQHEALMLNMEATALPAANLFSALDLEILETLLFSDEEQQSDGKTELCSGAAQPSTSMAMYPPSVMNV